MLEIQNISKSFSSTRVLKDVSFTVSQGEIHAVMGENGAGKSTLMKILCGVYPDYEGALLLDGMPLKMHSPMDAQWQGIAIIHQELSLIPELSIAENVFLGHEPKTPLGLLDQRRMAAETKAVLLRLQVDLPPHRLIRDLRVGEQQIVEVAKALAPGARLLILDEPTSALSEAEIRHLFSVIAALKAQGVTMIYISHKLEEIFELTDRITVLRDGECIGTRNTHETDPDELIRMMVGRPVDDLFPKEEVEPGDEALSVRNLSLRTGAGRGRSLEEISFSLRRGEIVGVAGLMGAGRTELLETLFGVPERAQVTGAIFVDGKEIRPASPRDAISAGLAFVTEDRKNQSLVMTFSVRQNITLIALKKFERQGLIRRAAETAAVQDSISKLHIKTTSAETPIGALSGGNQQKVVLAKCLLTEPKVLLLDEPTRGIDVGAKAEIYALISRLAHQGAGILMASSEMPELLAMCDRIMVLCEGKLTAILLRAEATQERIMEAATARREAYAD
ncbi:MAG: sugar ABC transporter ATP-binding protein [Janthinobacterium lividum]